MPYIYSTSTADININLFAPAPPSEKDTGKARTILKTILIKGGANVLTRKTIATPLGASTKVTDDELESLQKNPIFNKMVKNGFFHVDKKNIKVEKAVKDLNAKDKSAPKVASDFPGDSEGNLKPIVKNDVGVMV